MPLDRQSIEKRDFPISRRGYDPASVDAHLRTLAAQVEELIRSSEQRADDSLASTAGSQVRSILEAAQATAVQIEQEARSAARAEREAAASDAAHTREQAIAQSQAHLQAVSQATATLLDRVNSMDSESSQLVSRLRAGAQILTADLESVQQNVSALYDAASNRAVQTEAPAQNGSTPAPAPAVATSAPPVPEQQTIIQTAGSEDLDGARLVALNMALNGESREQTERFLIENYTIADRQQLLDEVYAAIDG